MSIAYDMISFFNYIKENQHRGLFSSGYDVHYNIIQSFLIKDNATLNYYSICVRYYNNFPNMRILLEIINFVNLQNNKHRHFCIQMWLHIFRSNEITQLENQLTNIFLN